MAGRIVGAHLKLRRAQEHLDAFQAAIEGFFEDYSNPFEIERHSQPDDTYILIKGNPPKQLDPMIGTIVGDFANNARPALDYIVAYVERLPKYGGPGTSTQFPIYVEDNWGRMRWTLGKLADAPEFVEAIKGAQPYTRLPQWPSRDILAILAGINNTDKHGSLYAASTWFGVSDLELIGATASQVSIEPISTRMERNTPLALVHIAYGGGDAHVQVKLGGTFYVALYAEGSSIPAVPAVNLMKNILYRVEETHRVREQVPVSPRSHRSSMISSQGLRVSSR